MPCAHQGQCLTHTHAHTNQHTHTHVCVTNTHHHHTIPHTSFSFSRCSMTATLLTVRCCSARISANDTSRANFLSQLSLFLSLLFSLCLSSLFIVVSLCVLVRASRSVFEFVGESVFARAQKGSACSGQAASSCVARIAPLKPDVCERGGGGLVGCRVKKRDNERDRDAHRASRKSASA